MQTVCISLGGSIVSKESGIDLSFLDRFAALLKRDKDHRFIIIVGGGNANKWYLNQVRKGIKDNMTLDAISIYFTRINALTVKGVFERERLDVHSSIVRDLETAALVSKVHKIVLMGGLVPGITTDCVGVLAAEAARANLLVNVSNTAYVYDKDPRAFKDAKPFKTMTYDQLINLAAQSDTREAKANFVFDLVGCKLAKRSGIKIAFVKDDIKEIEAAVNGKKHNGTTVQ